MTLRFVAAATVIVTLFLLMYNVYEHTSVGLSEQIEAKDRKIDELERKLKLAGDCERQLVDVLSDAVHYKELAENCVHEKVRIRAK